MQNNQWSNKEDFVFVSLKQALLISLFKLLYTQIFGIYAGFVYLKTGSLWPAVALHSYCNYLGFPAIQNLIGRDYRNTDRIICILLYLGGAFITIFKFNWFFNCPEASLETNLPWWDLPAATATPEEALPVIQTDDL